MKTIRRAASWAFAALSLGALVLAAKPVGAFGDEGAFNPRMLLTGTAKWEGVRTTAPARWSRELITRTSAPARLVPTTVRADEPGLLAEPFAIWGGEGDVPPLTDRELSGLKRFIALGGMLLVDDFAPETGAFGRAAKRELARVVPEGTPVTIRPDPDHLERENVLYHSFYRKLRPVGRFEGPAELQIVVRGGFTQILYSEHDLLGALARGAGDVYSLDVRPGGEAQRRQAVHLAINIAMYVLCTNYKDDTVHGTFLMRRRGPKR